MTSVNLVSHRKLRIELTRIKRLYLASMYSYNKTITYLENELILNKIDNSSKIIFNNERISNSPSEMKSKLENRFPEMLRESLFVRIVSIIDIFFGDVLKELAKRTIEPFKTQNEKKYHVAQLLSFRNINEIYTDIIEDQIRNFTSKGYKSINKYYSRQIGIDMSKIGKVLMTLEEIYERRHLFVHADGKIDAKYQRLFSSSSVQGERLSISEGYFFNALSVVQQVADYISEEIEKQWPIIIKTIKFDLPNLSYEKQGVRRNRYYAIFKSASDMKRLLSEEYEYGFKNQGHYLLKDILAERTIISNNEARWVIAGDKNPVGMYRGFIRYLERRGFLNLIEFEDISFRQFAFPDK